MQILYLLHVMVKQNLQEGFSETQQCSTKQTAYGCHADDMLHHLNALLYITMKAYTCGL